MLLQEARKAGGGVEKGVSDADAALLDGELDAESRFQGGGDMDDSARGLDLVGPVAGWETGQFVPFAAPDEAPALTDVQLPGSARCAWLSTPLGNQNR